MFEDEPRFEWDEEKAEINKRKHGVTFKEAREVFRDPHAVDFFDRVHSDEEARYQRIGLSGRRLLFVVYTEHGDVIRIIHARKATKTMARIYEEERKKASL